MHFSLLCLNPLSSPQLPLEAKILILKKQKRSEPFFFFPDFHVTNSNISLFLGLGQELSNFYSYHHIVTKF